MFFLILGILIGTALSRGYVLSVLWGWYIVPAGFPAISLITAMGISIIVGFLTFSWSTAKTTSVNLKDIKTPEKEEAIKALLQVLFNPWVSLGIGWAILKIAAFIQ